MENARLLDERLRKIIREVSTDTGTEIKRNLVTEFEKEVGQIIQQEMVTMLKLIRRVLNEI
ncbi:MAG: hypothetical protein AB1556_01485 [Bacillota bacterium]